MSIQLCLAVFFAGGFGALSRFLVSEACVHFLGRGWPYGTMVVNILGCLLFGLVVELAAGRHIVSEAARIALCAGFLGGFTTFSSLIFDSAALGQIRPLFLALNIAAQIILGFGALRAGEQLGRLL